MLISLKWLSISHNELTDIGSLLDLKKLEYLDISYNQLEDINGSFLPSSLKAIVIEGNPFKDRNALNSYLLDRLPNLRFIDGQLLRDSPSYDFKKDEIERPVAKLEESFLEARLKETNRETLLNREQMLPTAKNSTKSLISQSFASDLIETPATEAQEAAEKMRYRFLVEHTLYQTEFEGKFRPFEDRHPQNKFKNIGK